MSNIGSHSHNMKNHGNDLIGGGESLLKAMRVILLAPIFIYMVVPFTVYVMYYAFCLIFSCVALLYGVGRDEKVDPFSLWVAAWFIIAVTLDLINGSDQITLMGTLGYTISVLCMVIVFKVRFREMALMIIIGAAIYYVYRVYYLGHEMSDHGRAVAITIVALVLIIKRQYKWASLFMAFFFFLVGRNAWLALFVSLFLWFTVRSARTSARRRMVLLSAVLIVVIAVPMLIGIFFGDSMEMFLFTTQRSLYYSVMVDEAYNRGVDILLPVSNNNAEEILTAYIQRGYFFNFGDLAEKIENYFNAVGITRQVPHSAYLEILANYGLVVMAVMLIWLVRLGNRSYCWPLVVHFMVAIMTDSEYFNPFFIVPYVIAYRELYFHHNEYAAAERARTRIDVFKGKLAEGNT